MNTLELVQSYLLEPSDTVSPTDRECYRLTVEDKRQIEAAIEKHGAQSLGNVTKGGAMLYLRFPMRFAGDDERYLRALFAPDTVKWEPLAPGERSDYEPMNDLPRAEIGWPIKEEKVCIPYTGGPERVAISLLSQNGWKGVHTEGHTIRSIFRALLLPYLYEHNPYKSVDPVHTPLCHAIHYLIPMTAGGLQRILDGSREVPRHAIDEMHKFIDWRLSQPLSAVQKDFEVIADAHGSVWPKTPGSDLDISDYLSAVPRDFWHNLLEIYARYDGALSNGWPDLELTNGKEIMMVEVKARDKLTAHQRLTIPVLMALGMKCKILRIINSKQ
ncbi:hypothetical protein HBO12_16970 [Pseudomonas sp. WS 5059]|uniref:hypothetical protein n=1 Tax=Pseudomonas sp. WS 5059 TaxID=2717491 RepID=UPI001473EDC1|nr:hypothetical protein [Pseudomonas sp. WS 5059]NMY04654.1 hypothetical protein [Pseudomonas sp. WS 5059]